ncbi:sortase [Leucobacter luti]|uniref:sortase n=1 Tax=Leucobacter luti TaxID=340320 RepID=UPI003D07E8AD
MTATTPPGTEQGPAQGPAPAPQPARRRLPLGRPGPRGERRKPAPARTRRPLLPPAGPRELEPRGGRWWAGAVILTISLVILGFMAHTVLLTALQHHRDQSLAYTELRTSLAEGRAPTGQLVSDNELTPLGTPVAYLESAAIGLREVVLQGSDANTLRSGIGHRRDSVMPGQAGTSVILGRQLTYGGPFAKLHRLQPGDEVSIMTGQGEHVYRVFGLRRGGDPLPEPLRAKQGRLELQTADGLALFPSGVLYVDAELVSEPQPNPSRVLSYPALPSMERAMGADRGAWFIAFFAFVFLTAAAIAVAWLWRSWGRWHAWVIGVPLLVALGAATSDLVMNAMPNLL